MSKRLSVKEKIRIVEYFTLGKTIDELAMEFNCTKLTISRNLKKDLGEKKYKEFTNQFKSKDLSIDYEENKNFFEVNKEDQRKKIFNENDNPKESKSKDLKDDFLPVTPFLEIAPLSYEIDNAVQYDLSSTPISEIDFPNIVYMIVDKKVELETKYLRDYADWQFLSNEELNRKTIEIFFDLKIAKRFCNKEQKVIKVPNTNVFKIAAPLLIARGITRIVSSDKLIAL